MKALVIGATGIIGNNLVRHLLKEGLEVRTMARGITPALNMEGLEVEKIKGDLNDTKSVEVAMKGCDWVFHTAPYYPTNPFNLQEHKDKAMKGMMSVLSAAQNSSLSRFVYTSSLTTIGSPHQVGQLSDETCVYDLPKPPHPYFAVKVLMEEAVKKAALAGLPAVIVNPTGCFGPYELKPINNCLIPQLVLGKIPAYIQHNINIVDIADVALGHFLAAQKGRIGERYILGAHNVTIQWLMETIARVAGVKTPKIHVPVSAAIGLSYLTELWAHLTKTEALFPLLGVRFVQFGQHFDISKAEQELGYRISAMEPCFERALKWYQKIGYC